MQPNPACLDVRALVVERGDTTLFSDLSFSADAHTLVHLKGPNGSGKTTALQVMAGLVAPAGGEVTWCDIPIAKHPRFAADLNYVGHLPGLNAELSALENLAFISNLGVKRPVMHIAAALERLSATPYASRPVRQLSAGQRQRVALSRLVLFDCRLWMLDEPFTALDAASRELVEALINQHISGGGIVVIATHQAFKSCHPLREISLTEFMPCV